jgi:hypothetical protein
MTRHFLLLAITLWLLGAAFAQEPASPGQTNAVAPFGVASADSALNKMFEAKIHTEWEAIKNKDKKAYGELLADDYQGVGIDGRGERNKIQSMNDLDETNTFNYALERFKTISLGPDAAFVIYESTLLYPPKAQLRYSRLYIGELWVKRYRQWKLLHYQETHVK